MSGSSTPPGARALFANAPVLPAAPTLPTVAPGSNLATAMMAQTHPLNLQTPQMNIPLASMMSMMKGNGSTNPTPGHNQSSLYFDQNGQLQGTPGQPPPPPPPQTLSWASDVPQQQGPAQGPGPGMPVAGAPGVPSVGAPGMPSGGGPGTPSMGAVGTPGSNQPGLFGQTMNWLQNLYGGSGGGG